MYSRGLHQFFIEELAQLASGGYVIPHDWVIRGGKLTAQCSAVTVSQAAKWTIADTHIIVPATDFSLNYHDIVQHFGSDLHWAGALSCVSFDKFSAF